VLFGVFVLSPDLGEYRTTVMVLAINSCGLVSSVALEIGRPSSSCLFTSVESSENLGRTCLRF